MDDEPFKRLIVVQEVFPDLFQVLRVLFFERDAGSEASVDGAEMLGNDLVDCTV